jgi:hypothetical protein
MEQRRGFGARLSSSHPRHNILLSHLPLPPPTHASVARWRSPPAGRILAYSAAGQCRRPPHTQIIGSKQRGEGRKESDHASPRDVPQHGALGLVLAVGTLRTGYPHIQASSQDNSSRLPAGGSSEAVTCPRGSVSRLPARDSSGAATCPCGTGSSLLARGSSGTATWHLGSSTHHLAHGSSGAPTCPKDRFYRP